jgi:hypothetical protein
VLSRRFQDTFWARVSVSARILRIVHIKEQVSGNSNMDTHTISSYLDDNWREFEVRLAYSSFVTYVFENESCNLPEI